MMVSFSYLNSEVQHAKECEEKIRVRNIPYYAAGLCDSPLDYPRLKCSGVQLAPELDSISE